MPFGPVGTSVGTPSSPKRYSTISQMSGGRAFAKLMVDAIAKMAANAKDSFLDFIFTYPLFTVF
jgi:hypothetical protein